MARTFPWERFGGDSAQRPDPRKAAAAPPPPKPKQEQPLWRDGYETGEAAARSAAEADGRAAAQRLMEALADEQALREEVAREARRAAIEALRGVVRRLRPALAERGLADEIATALAPLIEDAELGESTLYAPLETVAAVDAALAGDGAETGGRGARAVSVVADPGLSGAQARLVWRDGLAELDFDAVGDAIERALEASVPKTSGTARSVDPEPSAAAASEPAPAAPTPSVPAVAQ